MDETINKVRRFVSKIAQDYHLKRAILFGSRARGDYLKESDFDLILVSDDFGDIPFPERASRLYKYREVGLPLDIYAIQKKNLKLRKRELAWLKRQ